MNIPQLVIREIRHRGGNFLLSVASTVAAVAVVVALVGVLTVNQKQTDAYLAEKQKETEELLAHRAQQTKSDMAVMEDDYRKIMKKLGFNLVILSADQDLGEYYQTKMITATMPEQYAEQLANSDISTVQHFAPCIEQMIEWPEQDNRKIILAGTRGEIPRGHRRLREPIIQPVQKGAAAVGHHIARDLDIEPGDTITLRGETFTVAKINPECGNADDITVTISLREAQEMLNMPGEVHAIVALKCHCAGKDVEIVRQQVADELPNVQVLALLDKVVTRADARDRAHTTALATIDADAQHRRVIADQEQERRDALMERLTALAAWFLPLIIIGTAVWIGLLALMNVQRRAGEIGILRAIGYRDTQVYALVLSRLLVIGLAGGLFGFVLGAWAASWWCGEADQQMLLGAVMNPIVLIVAGVGAPLLSVVAGLPPAVLAVLRDPADVLRQDA